MKHLSLAFSILIPFVAAEARAQDVPPAGATPQWLRRRLRRLRCPFPPVVPLAPPPAPLPAEAVPFPPPPTFPLPSSYPLDLRTRRIRRARHQRQPVVPVTLPRSPRVRAASR